MRRLIPFLLLIAAVAPGNAEIVFDAAAAFPSAPGTPATNGVWTYGYSTSLGGTFNIHTAATSDYFGGNSGAVGFYTPLSNLAANLPTVLANETGSPATFGTITAWSPSLLLMHPGQTSELGEYSIVRFVAPDDATYDVSVLFQGLDNAPTSSDVHVLVNGSSAWDSAINSYGAPNTNDLAGVDLQAGDTVDFVVGLGSDGNFFNDSTGFEAVITEGTPEPATWMLGISGLGLAVWKVRNRRARG